MTAFKKLFEVELKLYLREPLAVFFTLIFPVMMLFLFGGLGSQAPRAGGRSTFAGGVPGYIAMIVATTGLVSLPAAVVSYREQGVFRRLQVTPVHPSIVILARLATSLLMTALGVALLISTGRVAFGVRPGASAFSLLSALLLSCAAIFSLGILLASLLRTSRTSQAVTQVLLFPMLFLSGAALPREMLSETLARIGAFLPLTYVVRLLQGLWAGEGWGVHVLDVAILVGVFTVATLISNRSFRWQNS